MDKLNDYSAVAKVLHWLMAILILLELGIAYLFLAADTSLLNPFQDVLYYLHFNFGFSILVFFVIRVIW
jgi:cytochrome b561